MTTVVEMIGAGPGDPDLLTLRAEAALAAATVVVVDSAVAHLATGFAPGATVSVTAADAGGAVDGDAIRILTGAARRDERVVRLYRGDPWLHPAYPVESGLLASAGVDHVAVPGPSVEIAGPGAAGVPVHDPARAVTLTIAVADALPPAHDPARTLVTLTDDVAAVATELARTGDPTMPAAVVELGEGAGTLGRGTLAALADADRDGPEGNEATGPAVLVVGAVAAVGTGAMATPATAP